MRSKKLPTIFNMKNNEQIMKITDDKLLRIALITSLVGMVGLIIFTPTIEVKEVDLDEINRGMIDEEVKVDGVVTDVAKSSSGSSYFLTLTDGNGQTQVIIFENEVSEIQSNYLDIESFRDRKVEAVGKITEYNSNLELILSSGDSLKIAN